MDSDTKKTGIDRRQLFFVMLALLATLCVLAGVLMGMAIQQDTDYKTAALQSAQGRACVKDNGAAGYCRELNLVECQKYNYTCSEGYYGTP